MAKSLIILMLMTTQLFAGSGESVYLCISNDGSYCCLDAGPETCTCCRNHEEPSEDACCSNAACAGEVACGHHDETSPCPNYFGRIASDPCGCTHIPVMSSAAKPTTIARTSVRAEAERLALLDACLPTCFIGVDAATLSPHLRWTGPPAVPDFTLTVISTVVIRC
jgi:hypothetical protein